MSPAPATVRELLREAEHLLADFETPRLDAEVLLSALMRESREWFYAHPEAEVADDARTDFARMLHQRRQGYPVAYMVGWKEFWSLPLGVNCYTLIPRPETERLVEAALDMLPANARAAILDLGTGSGAVALAIARERPGCALTATDVSAEALDMAALNAARLEIVNVEFLLSDWFSALAQRRFGVIVSNPPYVSSADEVLWHGATRFEPRLALDGGRAGLDVIRRLIPAAAQHLLPGGRLLLEHGMGQDARVRELFAMCGYSDIHTLVDAAGRERVTYATLA
jgi:release factor glutamine methyltransferase